MSTRRVGMGKENWEQPVHSAPEIWRKHKNKKIYISVDE